MGEIVIKEKKNLYKIILPISIFILLIGILLFLFLRKNENKLTFEENKWIENNKYNLVDVSILNDVPILSYSGSGIIYSYFDYLSDKYSLKFNLVTQKEDSVSSYDYYFDIANSLNDNSIKFMDDNLVLITNDNSKYIDFESIDNLTIGIVQNDKLDLSNYFKNKNVTFIEYDSYKELNSAFNDDTTEEENKLDGIITLKILFMEQIINNNYNISFDFNDLIRYYVIKTNGANELNSILSKGYNLWSNKYFKDEYNKYKLESYFNFKNISDIDRKNLQSKKYKYGFVEYGIYNYLNGNSLQGLSNLIINDFNEFSNLSMTYTRYNNISKMVNDLEAGKIDFVLNIVNTN